MIVFSVEIIGHVVLFRGELDFIYVSIVRTRPRTPILRAGGSKFWLSPPGGGEGGDLKNKKGGGSMVQEQVILKAGLALSLFNFFKVYHFYN